MPLTAGERYAVASAKAKAAPRYSVPKVNARIQGASMAQHQRGGQLTVAPRDQYQHGHATITGATEATHQHGGYGAALPATKAASGQRIASAYTGVRPGSTSASHPAHTPATAGGPKSQPKAGPTPTPRGKPSPSGGVNPHASPAPSGGTSSSGPTPTSSPYPGDGYTPSGIGGMRLLEMGAIAAVAVLLLIYMRKGRR